uniref:Uncharacterized protein n=1 Tax=Setaria viridis TaxID=4556 RepID=A0A4U6UY27_SETVI|nr:hypothetical protein SEVIR_4G114101v2 [Setaria viridis]
MYHIFYVFTTSMTSRGPTSPSPTTLRLSQPTRHSKRQRLPGRTTTPVVVPHGQASVALARMDGNASSGGAHLHSPPA